MAGLGFPCFPGEKKCKCYVVPLQQLGLVNLNFLKGIFEQTEETKAMTVDYTCMIFLPSIYNNLRVFLPGAYPFDIYGGCI